MSEMYDCLKEICERRKSRRAFKDLSIPDNLLQKIQDIANTSPYASAKQNWDIQVITDRTLLKQIADVVRQKIHNLNDFIDEEFLEGFNQYALNYTFFENAPAVIFLNFRVQHSVSLMFKRDIQETDKINDIDFAHLKKEILEWERDNYVKSISCVAMNVLLAAESLGLGACYMTGPLIAEKEIAKLINLKKGRTIGAIMPIGYY